MTDPHAFIPHIDARVPLQLRNLVELIATTDDPNLLAEFYEQADSAGELFRDQIHSIVRHVNNLKALAQGTQAEIDRLEKLRDERLMRAERLEDTVAQWMASVGETAIMWEDATVRTRVTPASVVIDDEDAIPKMYMRTKITTETKPDKMAIKGAIANGIDIPGCRITNSVKLEIK